MADMIRAEQAAGEDRTRPRGAGAAVRGRCWRRPRRRRPAGPGRSDGPAASPPRAPSTAPGTAHGPREYRRLNHLDGRSGTAVTVQAMVFGNSGGALGRGRRLHPQTRATGEKRPLRRLPARRPGRGRGLRPPHARRRRAASPERLPRGRAELAAGAGRLERALGDVQDIEFTVEEGRLYFLQTRPAKRTPRAVLRTAVDLVREGLITPAEGLARVAGVDVGRAGVARFVGEAPPRRARSPPPRGVATGAGGLRRRGGRPRLAARGQPVILVRREISTDDLAGFAAAAGMLTAVGGRTAHAAVVARQLGKACLVGCSSLVLGRRGRRAWASGLQARRLAVAGRRDRRGFSRPPRDRRRASRRRNRRNRALARRSVLGRIIRSHCSGRFVSPEEWPFTRLSQTVDLQHSWCLFR